MKAFAAPKSAPPASRRQTMDPRQMRAAAGQDKTDGGAMRKSMAGPPRRGSNAKSKDKLPTVKWVR